MPWRLWLGGQQNLPPNIAPSSSANSTLHRFEALPQEELRPEDNPAGATGAPEHTGQLEMSDVLIENLRNASAMPSPSEASVLPTPGVRTFSGRNVKRHESWQGSGDGGGRKQKTRAKATSMELAAEVGQVGPADEDRGALDITRDRCTAPGSGTRKT